MTITAIITAIIVGAIIGALGRLLLPGRQPIGWVLTIVVGIIAALVGTAIARAIGVSDGDGFNIGELLIQVVLAVIGVAIVAGVTRRGKV